MCPERTSLSAWEALEGFTEWLMRRDEEVVMAASHTRGHVRDLVIDFCMANNLPCPRRWGQSESDQPDWIDPEQVTIAG